MSDPRLQSIHLDGLPRQEQFRAAREAIRAACGQQTLVGDLGVCPDDRLNAPTAPPPAGAPLACYLRDGTHVHPLHVGMNSVGRLPDNDVVVRDECVSRRHCAVLVHTDFRCELHDVASKNGTVLNGKKIGSATRLHSGDQITLCNRKLTFVVAEGAAAG